MDKIAVTKQQRRSLSIGRLIISPRASKNESVLSTSAGHLSPINSPRSPKSMSPKSSSPRIELLSPKLGTNIKRISPIGIKGGSGTEIWKVKVDGWICCCKSMDISDSTIRDVESFKNEIKILQSLPTQNKHLVQYLGFQQVSTRMEVFMTLYEGNLFDLIQLKKPFTAKEITKIAYQILSALIVLHSRRLIHRDIKSHNVFYEIDKPNENIYVLGDFGESKILKRSKTSTIAGTSRWIAPEVMVGDEYSLEADMWSFGMLLYELMTLELPYYDAQKFGIEKRIIAGDLPTLTIEHKQTYACLIDMWEHCLAIKPEDRLTAAKGFFKTKILLEENLV